MSFSPFMRESFIPLPVVFISTISADGIRNIAPTCCLVPVLPPLDLIAAASAHKRDSLHNIRDPLDGVSVVQAVRRTAICNHHGQSAATVSERRRSDRRWRTGCRKNGVPQDVWYSRGHAILLSCRNRSFRTFWRHVSER